MNYITFILNPFPCMSVTLKFLPPDILFKILPVALPISGSLVLADTAIPINGLAILRAFFKNLFPACSVPLKISVFYF